MKRITEQLVKVQSISAKLLGAFAVAIVLSIAAAIQPIQAARGAQSRFQTVFSDRVVPLEQLGLILHNVNAVTDAQNSGGVSTEEITPRVMVQQVDSMWSAYLATYLTPEEARTVDELRTPMTQWLAAMKASIGGDQAATSRGEALHHALVRPAAGQGHGAARTLRCPLIGITRRPAAA